MEIKKEQAEQIINFGVFDYDSQKIANILDIDKKMIDDEMKNSKSELNSLLQKGRDMSDYVIDLKLFEMAKDGDIKALDKIESRKRAREFEKNNK